MTEIVIKVNNISQIRQIAESLPEKFLSETVLNNGPILNYLRNTLIFHREKKIFSIERLNKMFVPDQINTGQVLGSKGRILAGLEHSKNEVPFEIWRGMARLASFSSYAPARVFLNNLNSDSLKYIDLTFHIKRINADKLIKINPRWFAVYTDEEGGVQAAMFLSELLDEIISGSREGENISVWGLRRNIFAGNLDKGIQKYWTNTLDCRGLIYNKNMTELNASSENAFKLYNFLNKGERKHTRVNGILPSKIKEKYLRLYLNNICGRTSLYFDETMFRNIKPGGQWTVANENGGRLGYIQNIRNYNTKYYIFTGEKLLSTVNFWPEVEKFINSLDKSIMDSIRISYHPDWNGICRNGIKDEKCYLLIYGGNETMFKSEGCSVPFRSGKDWNEAKVIDFKDNLKQTAKLKREINEYCNI